MAKRWYIVHAYSNFEKKVADSIREQAKSRGLSHLFDQEVGEGGVMVPTERVIEMRRGRKVDADRGRRGRSHHQADDRGDRPAAPGRVVRGGRAGARVGRPVRVVQRHGRGGRRQPLAAQGGGVDLRSRDAGRAGVRPGGEAVMRPPSFRVDELVGVRSGPFKAFRGTVVDIDAAGARLKVSLEVYGRQTPVELDVGQVEKLQGRKS